MDAERSRRVADLLIERGLLDAVRAEAFVEWLAASATRAEDLAAVLSDAGGLSASQIAEALGLEASALPTAAPAAPGEATVRDALRAWLAPGTRGLAQDLLGPTPPAAAAPSTVEAATPTVRLDGSPPAASPAGATQALVQRRYEVLRRVSKGGMGAILLCWDRELRREVAMKVMLAGSAARRGRCGSCARHGPPRSSSTRGFCPSSTRAAWTWTSPARRSGGATRSS